MDVRKYGELKTEGKISISKVGEKYVASQKQYVIESGAEDIPITTRLDIEDLQSRKAYLQEEIDAIDIVIADCQALDEE